MKYTAEELIAAAEHLKQQEFHSNLHSAYASLNEIDAQIKALKQKRKELCQQGWFAER